MSNEQHNAPAVALPTGLPADIAPPLARNETASSTQYSWSTDEETYQDQCESIEHAISEAMNSGREFDVGQVLYIGEAIPVTADQLIDADVVIETMQCRAYDACGESAECYLDGVTKEQRAQLEAILVSWADSVEKPNFWEIGKVVKHTITAEDLGETLDSVEVKS